MWKTKINDTQILNNYKICCKLNRLCASREKERGEWMREIWREGREREVSELGRYGEREERIWEIWRERRDKENKRQRERMSELERQRQREWKKEREFFRKRDIRARAMLFCGPQAKIYNSVSTGFQRRWKIRNLHRPMWQVLILLANSLVARHQAERSPTPIRRQGGVRNDKCESKKTIRREFVSPVHPVALTEASCELSHDPEACWRQGWKIFLKREKAGKVASLLHLNSKCQRSKTWKVHFLNTTLCWGDDVSGDQCFLGDVLSFSDFALIN